MSAVVPWPAVGSVGAGVISLSFIRYLWPYRDTPGAKFFIGTIGCVALWALSYGVALLVFDPVLRAAFEPLVWLGINFVGVFFLAFALEYTGRGHLVRSKLMGGIVLLQVLHTLVVVTNPLHHIAWRNYQIEPVLGAATVSYTHQPWLFVNFIGIYLMVAAGSFLLVDTFFSYGPLYRAQTAAIALSPVVPGVAFTLWLFEVGPSPPLNLTPLVFPVHLGFDTYAFFRRNMFELTPAARRAGERAAIDDLASPVVILDDDRQIINVNEAARRVLAASDRALLGRRLGTVVDDIDWGVENQTTAITTDGERREYAVSRSVLEDAAANEIGYTFVFQDITQEKHREQRLGVLSRVLRHNLRNDLNVVQMQIDMVADRVADEELVEMLTTANRKVADVTELAEQARRIERLLDTEQAVAGPVALRPVLEEIREALLAKEPAARIDVRVPEDVSVRSGPGLVRTVFENLLENAIEHNDAEEPWVEIAVVESSSDGQSSTLEVRDDGPGIPEYERRILERGEETALEHGSGLGLWTVKWGVAAMGGEVRFRADDTGTTVRLRLPAE